MLDLTNEKYLRELPSGFLLTILVSKRVKELKRGATPLIDTPLRDPVHIAFEEIKQGKIEVAKEDENRPTL